MSTWMHLRKAAELFNDAQANRIAAMNLMGMKADATPQNLTEGQINVEHMAPNELGLSFEPIAESLLATEKAAQKLLRDTYRCVVPQSIRDFQAQVPGCGEHLFARLMGRLGHPVIAEPAGWFTEKPEGHECDGRCKPSSNRHLVPLPSYERSVSQLLQYAGHGAPTIREKGMSQDDMLRNGNPQLKMLVHLISEALVKQGVRKKEDAPERKATDPYYVEDRYATSKYGQVYLDVRSQERYHTTECKRCGPSGKPAQPGSPWSKKHSHNAALRIVGKEFLKDLYRASKEES